MTLRNIFSAEAGHAFAYVADLGTFIAAPHRYLQRVAIEPDLATARRLAVYAAGFAVLQISLFSAAGGGATLSPASVVGGAVIDVVLTLVFVPAFVMVGRYQNAYRPLKTAIAYALTFRFVYFIVPLLLNLAFHLTEDYAFAALRGGAAYVYLLAYAMVLPLSINTTRRRRIIGLLLSVAAVYVTTIVPRLALDVIRPLRSAEQQTGVLAQYSLFYDPIGSEISRAGIAFETGGDDTAFGHAILDVRDTALVDSTDSSGSPVSYLRFSLDERDRWSRISPMVRDEIANERDRLEGKLTTARFATTRRLIGRQMQHLEAAEQLRRAMDYYYADPSASRLTDVLRKYATLMRSVSSGLTDYSNHLRTRAALHQWALIS